MVAYNKYTSLNVFILMFYFYQILVCINILTEIINTKTLFVLLFSESGSYTPRTFGRGFTIFYSYINYNEMYSAFSVIFQSSLLLIRNTSGYLYNESVKTFSSGAKMFFVNTTILVAKQIFLGFFLISGF